MLHFALLYSLYMMIVLFHLHLLLTLKTRGIYQFPMIIKYALFLIPSHDNKSFLKLEEENVLIFFLFVFAAGGLFCIKYIIPTQTLKGRRMMWSTADLFSSLPLRWPFPFWTFIQYLLSLSGGLFHFKLSFNICCPSQVAFSVLNFHSIFVVPLRWHFPF